MVSSILLDFALPLLVLPNEKALKSSKTVSWRALALKLQCLEADRYLPFTPRRGPLKQNVLSTALVILFSALLNDAVIFTFLVYLGAWAPYIGAMVDVAVPLVVTKHGNLLTVMKIHHTNCDEMIIFFFSLHRYGENWWDFGYAQCQGSWLVHLL